MTGTNDRMAGKKKRTREIILRLMIYFIGLWTVSLGIVLCVKCGLGISPISSVPFVLEKILPLSFGTLTMLFHMGNILFQYLLEKRWLNPKVFLQIPVAFLFGWVIDFLKSCLSFEAKALPPQLLCLLLSIFFTALGMVLMINMQLAHNPPDGTVRLISQMSGIEMGKVKIGYDISMVLCSMAIGLIASRRVVGFGIATIASALLVGRTLSFLQKRVGRMVSDGKNTI